MIGDWRWAKVAARWSLVLLLVGCLHAGAAQDAVAQTRVQPPVETPICRWLDGACEAVMGNRRLRIPANMVRYPMMHVIAPGREDSEFESGTVRTSHRRLRGEGGDIDGSVRVSLSTEARPRGLDQTVDAFLGGTWREEHRPLVRAARERGDATAAFTETHTLDLEATWEVVFRHGRAASIRHCQRIKWAPPGVCKVYLERGGLLGSFSFDRTVEPSTEEITGLVVALLNTLIVEGPPL